MLDGIGTDSVDYPQSFRQTSIVRHVFRGFAAMGNARPISGAGSVPAWFIPTELVRFLAFTLASLSFSLCPSGIHAADPTLPEITEALKHWTSSIGTLRLQYERRTPEKLLADHPELRGRASLDGYYFSTDFVWTDYGASRIETHLHWDGKPSWRYLSGCDGGISFGTDYSSDEDCCDELRTLSLLRSSGGRLRGETLHAPLYGVWECRSGEWLSDLVETRPATLDGFEVLGTRERCARVSIDVPDLLTHISVWLTPEFDWLPRRVIQTVVSTADAAVESTCIQEIHTYQFVEPGLWFPWSGKLDFAGLAIDWQVKDIGINQRFDAGFFAPPAPQVGTWVEDHIRGRHYAHGGAAGEKRIEERRAQQATRNLAAASVEPVAGPAVTADVPSPRLRYWSAALFGVSLLALGYAFWLRRS